MSSEQKCRALVADLFNDLPCSGVLANKNSGDKKYISGRPDDEVILRGSILIAVECKGSLGSLYLGDPAQPTASECQRLGKSYDATGWHTHQRLWWQKFAAPLQVHYYIAALVSHRRDTDRFDYAKAGFFFVPPQAWLELEAAVSPRKTVSLSPDLERIIAYRSITLESAWPQYRLIYHDGCFHIPESHPIYPLLTCQLDRKLP